MQSKRRRSGCFRNVPSVAGGAGRPSRDLLRLLDDGGFGGTRTAGGHPIAPAVCAGVRSSVRYCRVDRGFSEVYPLDGGIARYGRERGDSDQVT